MATVALITEDGAAHRAPYQNALRDNDSIDTAYLVDATGATVEETKAVVGDKLAGTFSSVDKMLQAGRPDMAIVTMIAVNGPSVIRPLLEAGIHVMAEKPSCVRADDFAELAELADGRGLHLMLALANRLRPDVQDARRIVAEGGVGDLFAVDAKQVDDQTRIQRRLNDPDWTFQKSKAGGGHLSWLGIHSLDMILFITGEEVVEVSAMTPVVGGSPIDVEDLALVHLRMAGGAHVSLFSGYLMDRKGHSSTTVYGSDGWLRLNEAEQGALEWRSTRPEMRGVQDRRLEYDGRGGGYTAWVQETLRACLGEIDPPISAQEGLTVLRIVHAAYESAETGRRVELATS